ncbi:NAD-dependent histone deacetylase sir2 [Gonapodya sp. JEL0774]|nr:NAD-dependent histone deacetylase sir2 [Gonapodya sp. JEL0774]
MSIIVSLEDHPAAAQDPVQNPRRSSRQLRLRRQTQLYSPPDHPQTSLRSASHQNSPAKRSRVSKPVPARAESDLKSQAKALPPALAPGPMPSMPALYEDLMKFGVAGFVSRYGNFLWEAIAGQMKIWPSFNFEFELDANDFVDPSSIQLYNAQLNGHNSTHNFHNLTLAQLAENRHNNAPFHQFYQTLDGVAKRKKRADVRTPEDVIKTIHKAKNVLVIAGAGISTSLGIPDFRSTTGIYSTINPADFDLSEPQEIASFAKHGKLMRVYTQNIDGIEHLVEIGEDRVIQCHGTVESASCMTCGLRTVIRGSWVEKCMLEGTVARCPKCDPPSGSKHKNGKSRKRGAGDEEHGTSGGDSAYGSFCESSKGVMKPDCVFFHEALPARVFTTYSSHDHDNADLVIVVGSSLRVPPVNQLVHMVPPSVPRILINRERLPHVDGLKSVHASRRRTSLLAGEIAGSGSASVSAHSDGEIVDGELEEFGAFDVELLGECDEVVKWAALKMGWELGPHAVEVERSINRDPKDHESQSENVPNPSPTRQHLPSLDQPHTVSSDDVAPANAFDRTHLPMSNGNILPQHQHSGPRYKVYKAVDERVFAFKGAKY